MNITNNKDWNNFSNWWTKLENQQITESKFGEEAISLCNLIDPNVEVINLYTDTLEKLAWENNLHKN